MADEPGAANAPAATPAQSPAPAASSANTPAVAAPPAAPAPGDEPMTLEEARKLRRELNSKTAKLKEFEDAQAAADLAKLGDLEKANKQLADLQAKYADSQRAMQERLVSYEVRLAAAELQFHNPGAAIKLLDWSQLEFDEDGIPTNAAKLLKKLSETDPYLVKADGTSAPAAPKPAVGPTNPGRSAPAPVATDYRQMARFGTGQPIFKKD